MGGIKTEIIAAWVWLVAANADDQDGVFTAGPKVTAATKQQTEIKSKHF